MSPMSPATPGGHGEWDAVVVGSGIGGLAAAAALARRGSRVLLLEQHTQAGGQTQTFRRREWVFSTGVHYIGGVGGAPGEAGRFGRLLDWLSGGELRFAPCANPYDIVRLPGLAFGIPHPEAAYRAALLERFPGEAADIARWFEEMADARRAAYALFAQHSMPAWLAGTLRLFTGHAAERACRRTLGQALADVSHPQLRAVLGARWGDYGAPPQWAPLVEHALVTGSYDAGAFYPVGGPGRFAQTLLPPLRAAGGELRLGADVQHICIEHGAVAGVRWLESGVEHHARTRHVVSAMGAFNTLAALPEGSAGPWAERLRRRGAGVGFVALYIGLEGDIDAAGAGSANHWIYESDSVEALWSDPADTDAPGLFVSFPSAKDPAWQGPPTAEVLALVDSDAFAAWLHPQPRPADDYAAYKDWVAQRLLGQFQRHFPRLAPMVRFHEAATPLTQRRHVRTPGGSMYGLEMTGERLADPALALRTPVPGLLLAGQDVLGPGVQAAFMAGLLAAATIEPALWREFGR